MKQVRKCKYCGKEFVARSGMQKYCCEECQTKAKEARKKRQQDFMNAVEPVIGLQNQEYLTFVVNNRFAFYVQKDFFNFLISWSW